MSTRARRLGGALSLLALLALTAVGLASAGPSPNPPPLGPAKPGKITKVGQANPAAPTAPAGIHAIGYRLTANLAPAAGTSQATGHWDGILVHTVGVVRNGKMTSIPGCSVTAPKPGGPGQSPPRQSGLPHQIKCGTGAVPPFTVPGSGNHWILGWRLTYANLSSAVTGADLKVTVAAGNAPIAPTTLCSACVSGKVGRAVLTDDQANAVLKGDGSIVVRTTTTPDGEISGAIVKVTAPASPARAKTNTGK